eukprot:gene8093-1446_t
MKTRCPERLYIYSLFATLKIHQLDTDYIYTYNHQRCIDSKAQQPDKPASARRAAVKKADKDKAQTASQPQPQLASRQGTKGSKDPGKGQPVLTSFFKKPG